jgi:hypothetical protein
MIRALDRRSGQVKWAYDIRKDGDQSQFHGDPLITDQLIVMGTDGNIGSVCAFERAGPFAGRTRLMSGASHPMCFASKTAYMPSRLATNCFALI